MLSRTWKFFLLTFAISWLIWLPSVLRSNGFANVPALPLPGTLGPAIAAFILVGFESGRGGIGRLLRRAIDVGFSKRWLLPLLLLFPAVGILTAVILSLLGEGTGDWAPPNLPTAVITFLVILFIGGGMEEFGWRGYALDRMQTGRNAVVASLVLGFIWGIWHLPTFFMDGTVQKEAAIPIWEFVLQTMVIAVLYTWMYNNTRGSLLVAILFHTIGNTTSALLPPYFATELGRWVNFAILLVTVIIVIIAWGWQTLNKGQEVPRPSLVEHDKDANV